MISDQLTCERSVARHSSVEDRLVLGGDVALLLVGEGRRKSAVTLSELIQVEADPQELF